MESFLNGIEYLHNVVAFLANVMTLFLGCVAIWGLWTKGSELSQALRAVVNLSLLHQISRIKETLSSLTRLDADDKTAESQREIKNLYGQLLGQLKPLQLKYPKLKSVVEDLRAMIDSQKRLKESQKRELTHELQGELDSLTSETQGPETSIETKPPASHGESK